MIILKYIILVALMGICTMIGIKISQKYTNRLKELREYENVLNILESNIKFTYNPLPKIFEDISCISGVNNNVKDVLKQTVNNMKNNNASNSWDLSIDKTDSNLKEEDKEALKTLSKLLGQTDMEGQISQIEITKELINKNIKEAEFEKNKNGKMYKKLGAIIGLVIVVILF